VADGYAGVAFCVLLQGGLVPVPESGAGITKTVRGAIRLGSMANYVSLAALKSKVSTREIPWRNTVIVDVAAGPGIGALTWLDEAYSAILTNLSGPRTNKAKTRVLVQAEFLLITT
jgi:hypothetical protein